MNLRNFNSYFCYQVIACIISIKAVIIYCLVKVNYELVILGCIPNSKTILSKYKFDRKLNVINMLQD